MKNMTTYSISHKSALKYISMLMLAIGFTIVAISAERKILLGLFLVQLIMVWQARKHTLSFEKISFLLLIWTGCKYVAPLYQIWPLTFLLPLASTLLYSFFIQKPLRPMLTLGRIDSQGIKLAILASLVSIVALHIWLVRFDPDLQIQQGLVPNGNFLVLAAMLIGFALLNAGMEEIIYRGWWFQHTDSLLERSTLLLCQATAFGAAHVVGGVPGGSIGFMMTFCYALMLGGLRLYSGGLLLPLCVHITTDIYIGTILFTRS